MAQQSQFQAKKLSWLEQVQADAAKLTRRRLEDEGFVPGKEVQPKTASSRADAAEEAQIVDDAPKGSSAKKAGSTEKK